MKEEAIEEAKEEVVAEAKEEEESVAKSLQKIRKKKTWKGGSRRGR